MMLCHCTKYPVAHDARWCAEAVEVVESAARDNDLAFDVMLDIFRLEIGAA